MCANPPDSGSVPVDATITHALSNHLAVILGFAELMIAESGPDDPRLNDLLEVRTAALQAARLLGQTSRN